MNRIVKHSIAFLILCISVIHLYGQVDPAHPVKVDGAGGKDYYQHGYNKDGGPFTGETSPNTPAGQEVRDSLTVTAKVRYFALPDINFSPNWYDGGGNIIDVSSTANLNSNFIWSVKYSNGVTNGSTTPIVEITWNKTGIDSVKVQEVPKSSGACTGKETVIPVAVIDRPKFEFGQGAGATPYADGKCYTEAELSAKVRNVFPVSVTTQSSEVEITYNLKHTQYSGTVVTRNGQKTTALNGILDIELDDYGQYEVTVTAISDRISRKSDVDGIITASGATFTYSVMRYAQPGHVYRIPNS